MRPNPNRICRRRQGGPFEPIGKVYLITNAVTQDRYVGQTRCSIAERWAAFLKDQHCPAKLAAHIRDYGVRVFNVDLLEEHPLKSDLNYAEYYWIKYFDSVNHGYNQRYGTVATAVSMYVSDEYRLRQQQLAEKYIASRIAQEEAYARDLELLRAPA